MYNLTKIKNNTYYIETFNNVGVFVKNGITTLIDCGLDDEIAEGIDLTLKANGLTVNNIIVTHAHADHVGGANYFQQKYNTKILATRADTAICNISIMNTSLIYGGMPTNIAKGKMLYAKSCKADKLRNKNLPDGLQIVDLKGHSIAMIGVLTEDNVLFCADSLVSEKTIKKFPLTYILDIEQYFESMDKLIELKADYYLPSHSVLTKDITSLVEINKRAVKQNIVDILSVMKHPLEVNNIVYEYCKKFGYTLKKSQFFVVSTTIKNYLAYLEKINLVKVELLDNRLLFSKTED